MNKLNLQELQQVSLGILVDIHNFCVSHNLRYSIAYGTLLGAVRHKGFIPWDDDIDVVMPRPDSDNFCKLYSSKENRLLYAGNDWSLSLGFCRVADISKTRFEECSPWTKEDVGVWVDVFPIDGVEDDPNLYARRYHRLSKVNGLITKFRRSNHLITKQDSWIEIAKTLIARFTGLFGVIPHLLLRHMISIESRYAYENSDFVGQCSCLDDGAIQLPIEIFNDSSSASS